MSKAIADWRRFLTGRYAAFRTLAVSDAIAVALNGDSLSIPLITTLGASPALATLIGLFPFVGGILQGLMPAALRRNGRRFHFCNGPRLSRFRYIFLSLEQLERDDVCGL